MTNMTDAELDAELDRIRAERKQREAPHAKWKANCGELPPPEFTDEALALRFAERHVKDLRYVAAWSRWLRWDGTRWQLDDTLHAFDLARHVCREAATICTKASIAAALASAKTVVAAISLARSDRRLAATVDQWDADPWLLNTPKGAIDLRTGKMRPRRTEDYLTKITAAAPEGPCPMWHGFLDKVTAGDRELQCFLQRMAGYALTGLTREHALFFLYGTGANGKSVFVNTISGILGSITGRHRSRPSRCAILIGIRPTSPDCAELASSQRSRQKKAAAGPRVRSSS
jgi:phage/plasmid-associated DNA primase